MTGRGCAMTGWGSAFPSTVVSNDELAALIDTSDAWIFERSGIRSRHTATGPFVRQTPDAPSIDQLDSTTRLAIESGKRAIDSAGKAANDIGMLILCTTTPDRTVPATSSAVAGALGITGGAMDINAACAGFTYGLVTASALISAGGGNTLVIGAETLTRITNWEDRTNAFLFGDGAGAVMLEPVEGRGSLLGWNLGVDGSLVELLFAHHGSWIEMKGKKVFRQAVRATTDSARMALLHAEIEASDIALFVPHQANQRIMDAVADRLGISSDRVASVIEWSGNTSAASIPLTLVDAADRGRLHAGDLVLLAGFGAGMTWASAVWRWGGTTEQLGATGP
jgi:3-oxoacyl-[acyl-carrier-protein] synthase III